MYKSDVPSQISKEFEQKINTQKEDNERISWSTKKIEQLALMIDDGYKPKNLPFHEGNPIYRKGNIVFDYTNEEIKEIF